MINFQKGLSILDLLLQGKTPKEIIYELKVTAEDVSATKRKFPLFTGGTREYTKIVP